MKDALDLIFYVNGNCRIFAGSFVVCPICMICMPGKFAMLWIPTDDHGLLVGGDVHSAHTEKRRFLMQVEGTRLGCLS